EPWVKPPDPESMKKAATILNAIALDFLISDGYRIDLQDAINEIVSIIKRHPMTESEIMNLFSKISDKPKELLESLRKHPRVVLKRWRSMTFYHYKP
ncbi:hypothetical protein, partial [Thermotoga sp.]|uniref:hypothetical protein n=1 Tax=Thermotoga sp. TaxID=28240 RepID=UPI0025FA1832